MATNIGEIFFRLGIRTAGARKELNDAKKKVKSSTSDMSKSLKSLKRIAIASFSAWGVGRVAKDFVKASMEMDSMKKSLDAAIGSHKLAAAEMQNIKQKSAELGLAFKSQIKDYAILAASAKGTALEGEGVRKVWYSLMKASTALQMSTAQTSGVIYAFRDMLSKGTVQAEELKRQLGNRLPGALNLAAQAMGMTKKELMDMMKQGKIMAEEFLPLLAKVMSGRFSKAAIESAKSMRAELQRVKNEWFIFQSAFMEKTGANAGVIKVLQGASKAIKSMSSGIRTFKRLIDSFKNSSLAIEIGKFYIKAQLALMVMKPFGSVLGAIFKSMSRAPKIIGGIGTALSALAAGFIGWKIGTWMQNEFKIVRDAGIATVDSIMGGWIKFKYFFIRRWNEISTFFKLTLDGLVKLADKIFIKPLLKLFSLGVTAIGKSLSFLLDISSSTFIKIGKALSKAGFDKKATSAMEFAASLSGASLKVGKAQANINKALLAKPEGFTDSIMATYAKETAKAAKDEEEETKKHHSVIASMYADSTKKAAKKAAADKKAAEADRIKEPHYDIAHSIVGLPPKMSLYSNLKNELGDFGSVLSSYNDVAKSTATQIGGAFNKAFDDMASGLATFVQKGKWNFKDFANSVIHEILRIYIKQQMITPIVQSIGGMIGGTKTSAGTGTGAKNLLGSAPAKQLAGGGIIDEPVMGIGQRTGRSWSFGEKESEAVLNQGQIKSLKSSGTNVSFSPQINIQTPPETQASATTSDNGMNIDVFITAIEDKLSRSIRRGGPLGNTMQNTYGLNRAAGAHR